MANNRLRGAVLGASLFTSGLVFSGYNLYQSAVCKNLVKESQLPNVVAAQNTYNFLVEQMNALGDISGYDSPRASESLDKLFLEKREMKSKLQTAAKLVEEDIVEMKSSPEYQNMEWRRKKAEKGSNAGSAGFLFGMIPVALGEIYCLTALFFRKKNKLGEKQ